MSDLTSEVIKKLKVAELKAELSKRGLPTKGKKDELASRLLEATNSEGLEPVDCKLVDEDNSEAIIEEENPKLLEEDSDVKREDEQAAEEYTEDTNGAVGEQTTTKVVLLDTPVDNAPSPNAVQISVEDLEEQCKDNPLELEKDVRMVSSVSEEIIEEPKSSSRTSDTLTDVEDKQIATVDESELLTVVPAAAEAENASKKDECESTVEYNADDAIEKANVEATARESKEQERKQEEKGTEEETIVMQPEVNIEVEDVEETKFVLDENKVILDRYTSDLHFVSSSDGLSGRNLVKNDLGLLWCGVQANYGVKSGKVCYECKIVRKLEVELPDSEEPKHGIRIGWSAESSGLQLGEASLSYGYESSGKICASSNFSDYADPFGEGDIIGAYLDLESDPKTLKYTKNGTDLGIAMSLSVNLEGNALFPHFFIKNVEIEVNFGSRESAWHEMLEGYAFVQDCEDDVLHKGLPAPDVESSCEVIMMVGLPAAGKTTWIRKHCRENKDKHYYVIGNNLVFDRMKLQGQARKKSSEHYQQLMESSQKILAKFLAKAQNEKRNFIIDQTNVFSKVQAMKMEPFKEFTRKAVVVIPTYENLRRRAAEKKQRDGVDVPFDVLSSMKYFFKLPIEGELFDKVELVEQNENEARRIVDGYHREGKRAKERGNEEPQYKRQRYEHDRQSPRSNTDQYGGRYNDRRRTDRQGDSQRGGGYKRDYGGRSYDSGSYGGYGGGSYSSGSYGGGYGAYGGDSYGSGSYGQRSNAYGSNSYGSYAAPRGGYGGSHVGGSYNGSYEGSYTNSYTAQPSQRGTGGYRQEAERDRYRQGGGNYNQSFGSRDRGFQTGGNSGSGRGYVPRGGGWSQGYSGQQSYGGYQSGQSGFRGYGY